MIEKKCAAILVLVLSVSVATAGHARADAGDGGNPSNDSTMQNLTGAAVTPPSLDAPVLGSSPATSCTTTLQQTTEQLTTCQAKRLILKGYMECLYHHLPQFQLLPTHVAVGQPAPQPVAESLQDAWNDCNLGQLFPSGPTGGGTMVNPPCCKLDNPVTTGSSDTSSQ